MLRQTRLILPLVALALAAVPALPSRAQDSDTPAVQVIAHQGGDGIRPSNTMLAFEHAAALGVDMLEMDIHSTKDGVLVVIHDDTVDRTTDGTGRLQDLTFAEVQALDAGYNWPTLAEAENPDDHRFRGAGASIPALEEVFQAFPDYPMTIEIKQAEPSIVEPFCDLIHEYDMQEQVIVPSFNSATTLEFREACPDVATAATEDEVREFFVASRQGKAAEYEAHFVAFQVPEKFGNIPLVTEQFVADAHALGLVVQVWTPNTAEDMQRLIDLGVDGIMTDYPDVLLGLLGRDVPEMTEGE